MSESESDRKVTVTAQERAHPALRKLARACLALARQLVGESAPQPPSASSGSVPATKEGGATAVEEQHG